MTMGYTYDTLKRVVVDLDFRIAGGLKGLGHFKAGKASDDKDFMTMAEKTVAKLLDAIKLKSYK